MKGKGRWFLISAVLILGIGVMGSGISWGDDAGPPGAGVASDGQTTVTQAAPAPQPVAPSDKGSVPMTEVEVKAQKEKQQSQQPRQSSVFAGTDNGFVDMKSNQNATDNVGTATKEGITVVGGPGQTNMLKALDLLPSVDFEASDPYGFVFSPIQLRIRGQQAISLGTMIDGIPLWAIQQPGPRLDTFDLENFQSISLIRGAAPPDKGLGGMDTAGALDLSILKPSNTFDAIIKETGGSFDLWRTYARIDSGLLPTGTAFYVSGSTTSADKWKGAGDAPEYRDHLSFGITQVFTPFVKAELYGDYNNQNLYSYRALTYAQTKGPRHLRQV